MTSDGNIDWSLPIFTPSQEEGFQPFLLNDECFQNDVDLGMIPVDPMLSLSSSDANLGAVETFNEDLPINSSSATSLLPSVEKFQGTSGFHTACDQNGDGSWVFSTQLNKMFAKINVRFPVKFVWSEGYVVDPRVRVVLLFLTPNLIDTNVERCIMHSMPTDISNLNFRLAKHIVRCNDDRALYCTDPVSHRNSVVVPLDSPQAGTNSTTVMYSFVCQNSCPSGISRRPTQIVFTLEDGSGRVHGRDTMCVRSCSCPKRDKEKEEKEEKEEAARKLLVNEIPPTKRLKQTQCSDTKRIKTETGVESLKVSVADEAHRQQVVKSAHGHLLSNIALQGREPTAAEQLCLAEYETLLSQGSLA